MGAMANFAHRLELALAQGTALAILSTAACGGTARNQPGGSAGDPGETVLATAGGGDAAGESGSSIGGDSAGGRSGAAGGVETNGGASVGGSDSTIAGAGGDASVGGSDSTIAGAGGDAPVTSLQPYPAADLGCTGEPQQSGFHGQCCARAYCYTPSDGVCVPPAQAPDAVGRSYGSGECLCGAQPIAGPYAPNPTDTPKSEGSCCYIISAIGCDGRPLLVDGRAVTSELERRADWIDGDLLELLRS